jgi:hypothetical protein
MMSYNLVLLIAGGPGVAFSLPLILDVILVGIWLDGGRRT